jgi:hypothetical protein
MALYDAVGFWWDRGSVPREIPRASLERVVFRFRRMLPEYVWDAGVLEGNPFTFPEVKTLLEGVTIGGRKLSDQEQILNLAESSKYLMDIVKRQEFRLDKPTFCALHAIVARNEALEWGHFRGEGAETRFTPDVALGERGLFTPLPSEPGAVRLNEVFSEGVRSLEREISNPFERAAAFFLFGSLQQFFFDGNKRTSRFMMNGLLMSAGIDAVSIPAARAREFNSKMVDFYTTRDATEMMAFVVECHPSATEIHDMNPEIPGGANSSYVKHYRIEDPIKQAGPEGGVSEHPAQESGVRATVATAEAGDLQSPAFSLEEVRRKAREDWLHKYHGKAEIRNQPEHDRRSKDADPGESQSERGPGLEGDLEE